MARQREFCAAVAKLKQIVAGGIVVSIRNIPAKHHLGRPTPAGHPRKCQENSARCTGNFFRQRRDLPNVTIVNKPLTAESTSNRSSNPQRSTKRTAKLWCFAK